MPLTAVVTDIEGTVSPVSFVHRVLFPYARARLPQFCSLHKDAPVLAEVARLRPAQPVLETLLAWMDEDAKVTPLKTIQGMIWKEGYLRGELTGDLYRDVAPVLRRFAERGLRLYVYSSGSEAAQKLLFGHTPAGDLTPLFQGFFDTRIGPKRDPDSYRALCEKAGFAPPEGLFLSDSEAELDAAAVAGLATCQLVRPQDGTLPSTRHPSAADFQAVAAKFGFTGPS